MSRHAATDESTPPDIATNTEGMKPRLPRQRRRAEDVGLREERPRLIEPVQPIDPEPGRLDRGHGFPVRMTATRQPAPRTLDPILPAGEAVFGRSNVLEEEETTVRLQNAPGFSERRIDVGHR